MASRENALLDLTPEVLLKAYACGIFPMAETADDPALYWIEPEKRGDHPARRVPRASAARAHGAQHALHRHLRPRFRRGDRRLRGAGTRSAPAPGSTRASASSIGGLFEIGHCHTVEVYDGDALVGGLYGVRLGRAFFGESMFHLARDASKIALVHLVARMKAGGYRAARHAVPHRSPEDVRRGRSAARALSPHARRRAAGRRRHGRVFAAAMVRRAGAGRNRERLTHERRRRQRALLAAAAGRAAVAAAAVSAAARRSAARPASGAAAASAAPVRAGSGVTSATVGACGPLQSASHMS